ncbi:PAS domain S-box protein [Roseomonas sp. CCTCC AB2023176]|uniref:PAS domain S-box protein n=1 Tax=Roseomonas sp. CCTCC AB2023176 TaxID=3342640 RepID=UPI0035DB5BDA
MQEPPPHQRQLEALDLVRTIARARRRLDELWAGQGHVPSAPDADPTPNAAGAPGAPHSLSTVLGLFQSTSAGMIWLGPDWTISEVNPAFCSMLGFRRDDFLGLDFRTLDEDWGDPDWAPLVSASAERTGEPARTVRLLRDRHGVPRALRLTITPHIQADGPVAGYSVTALHDERAGIDEGRATIEGRELERAASRMARLGGWRLHLTDGHVRWSDEARVVLGLGDRAISSFRGTLALLRPAWRARVRAAVRISIRRGTSFDLELPVVSAEGWSRWIRIVGEAERDASGKVVSVVGSLQNISERKAAEDANRRLAERLAARVGSLPQGFMTLDGRLTVAYANEKALTLLGVTAQGLLGRAISEQRDFAASEPLGRMLRTAVAERRVVGTEQEICRSGLCVEAHAFPAEEGLTITLRDISDERAQRERLRLLESSIAHLTEGVLITQATPIDAPGPRIVFVNPAMERITGYAPEEMLGATPRILQGAGTQRGTLDRIRDAIGLGQPIQAELLNYAKDGREYWVELNLTPVADDEGRVTHFAAIQRDITERLLAQKRIAEQAALLNLVRDGIVVRTMQGQVVYANRSAESLYGWSLAELREGDPAPLVERVYEDRGHYDDAVRAVMRDGRWSGRLRQRRRDGTPITVDSSWSLVRDMDGVPNAILIVNTDVTERLAMEERLRTGQKLEAIGQLTAGVAHDFNNLLSVILGNAEYLTDVVAPDGEEHRATRMILDAAERGATLTSRLLAFSRQQTLDPQVVDIGQLVQDLAAMLSRTLGSGINLSVRCGPGPHRVAIDRSQLEAALLNLAINARDAMPEGGRLTFDVSGAVLGEDDLGPSAPGRYVEIATSDTGCGMAPEVLARAFEPFFTTKDVGKGSGLGLSMVYGFVTQSGGHVSIDSAPGCGTTVRLYLRAMDADATSPGSHAAGTSGAA